MLEADMCSFENQSYGGGHARLAQSKVGASTIHSFIQPNILFDPLCHFEFRLHESQQTMGNSNIAR